MTMANTEVAALIGLSHVQVSRIRGKLRLPGIETMARIRDVFDWSMDEQTRAREAGEYSEKFEEALTRYASNRSPDTAAGPEERTPAPQ